MAKHHNIAKAQKERAKNRRKHFNRIGEGIRAELEKKENAKRLKEASKAVEKVRKAALRNAQKDRVRLGKKENKKAQVKKVTKRTTKNGESK